MAEPEPRLVADWFSTGWRDVCSVRCRRRNGGANPGRVMADVDLQADEYDQDLTTSTSVGLDPLKTEEAVAGDGLSHLLYFDFRVSIDRQFKATYVDPVS